MGVFNQDISRRCNWFGGVGSTSADSLVDSVKYWRIGFFDWHVFGRVTSHKLVYVLSPN